MIRSSLLAVALAIVSLPALAAGRDINRFSGEVTKTTNSCHQPGRCACAADYFGDLPHNYIRSRINHPCRNMHLRNDPWKGGYWNHNKGSSVTTVTTGQGVTGHFQQDDNGRALPSD